MSNNDSWLNERAREVRASMEAIRAIESHLAYLQIGWRPPTGGWSIAQVFEHLIISDASYLPAMARLVGSGSRGATPWRPTLAGRLLIRSLSPASGKKLPAPRIYKPAAEPRANVVAEYLAIREQTLRLIERARVEGVDLRRNRMSSPVLSLIRMNLGDAFMVLVVHTQRHLQQIDRVRSHPGFPQG